ncbi:MAG: hypothetical protein RBT74_12760 [Tenuifilaceae bacterium]|jgi:hypothetical protein|nr:hypothetical protein [Tenuifilaceae bacterium]
MKLQKTTITALIILLSYALSAQEQAPESKIKKTFYGWAAWEVFSDSRKSREGRDGELYFYPLAEVLDVNGNDINAVRTLTMLSITTRLGYRVEGFEVLGAKGMSMVEGDFYGTNQDNINLLRIRHAMINLSWEQSQLTAGMTSHPSIINEIIPGTISFGAGAPFHALNRAPQIRFTYNITPSIKVLGASIINAYHRSAGPYEAQRNSGKPEFFGQISAKIDNTFMFGFSASYKWLRPRMEFTSGADRYKTEKELGSFYTHAFALLKVSDFSLKAAGYFGEELSFLNMIGGYGMVTGSDGLYGDYDYTSLNTLSLWLDANYKLDKFNLGLFGGYQSLLGANDNYTGIASATNDNLSHLYRVSPRIMYTVEKLSFAFEYMLTGAIYGKTWDEKRVVTAANDPVLNHRFIMMTRYSF